jgi:glycine dehydrogenase subunit 2
MDIAKRLLDYGFHAPTVYFPADGARGDDDRADRDRKQGDARRLRRGTLFRITEERRLLHEAPHTTAVSRPDEVQAARKPVPRELRWNQPCPWDISD